MNDDLIILTVDSPKYTGNYVVYRSDAPLTPASFSTALRLGDFFLLRRPIAMRLPIPDPIISAFSPFPRKARPIRFSSPPRT